jgi:phosphoglycolate phosphatase-like HAD superfamily hydrolase
MSISLQDFEKKHDFLICVDSDGCAVDTMDIKHKRCFGPCMVTEWGLEQREKPILDRWAEINLYSMTRGINRFKGLATALEEIDAQFTSIDGVQDLKAWVESAKELSNPALEIASAQGGAPILEKALRWSQAVNHAINELPWDVKKAFPGVKEGFEAVRGFADIAIVSSANRDAVEEEWQKFGLMELVDLVLCQDIGSKAHCIAELKKKGYAADHILMVGDAPGDKAAAETNGVFYYPILVRREKESWAEFSQAAQRLKEGTYQEYGEKKGIEFLANLSQNSQ